MTNASSKRTSAFWIAFMLVFSLVFPAGPAVANHDGRTLDVEPEQDTNVVGTSHTMTATLSSPVPTTQQSAVNVDFELESGPNDTDGATYDSPDLTCNVEPGEQSCTVGYVGTRLGASSSERTDRWRAWIDHDGRNDTTEADRQEQRDETSATGAGVGCSTVPSTTEPDCTDVVEKTWTEAPAGTLDCDDSGPPDTEREVNPSNQPPPTTGGDSPSNEDYLCRVRDAQGNPIPDVDVKGEVENGVNDPDATDGASYTSPDYTCRTRDETSSSTRGTCVITVTQNEGELGTAEICFWVGTAEQGGSLCANEPTGEAQLEDGSDTGNDLADQVEKTWREADRASVLDCSPETASNPAGTSHRVNCTVTTLQGDRVSGANVDAEATGANDPDSGDTPTTPDFTCTTRADDPATPTTNEAGTCFFTHGGEGGRGTTNSLGTTTYRAWIDADGNDGTVEADRTEGRNEVAQPGEDNEPDDTDVVQKTWTLEPANLTMTPETDSAAVGTCNAYTITVTDANGGPVEGVIVDVEQRHERATNNTSNDEPRVAFCTPNEGPNPSPVDDTTGDLRPPEENPDNPGTAGGETTRGTDARGQITIGITVSAANGSDGTGRVDLTAWYESTDNDDPDAGEPQDRSTKNWVASQARRIDCEPENATNSVGTQHVVTCTVRNSSGQPVQGESVTFTESGVGTISPTQATTDQNGQARATATSNETGTQTITGTITADTQGNEPNEIDECDRAANDPQGAPAGECSDSVTKNWVTSQARSIDCEPETATNNTGTQHVVTCTVRNAAGQPTAGEGVTFTETGAGTISPTQATTNSSGQVTTTATSTEGGTQTITGTITADTQGTEPADVDECDRAAGDPAGSQQGVCADSVEKTWIDQPECSDGADNDGDNEIDHPEDPGCESPTDDDESDPFPNQEFGGEQGQPVNDGACAGFTTGSVQQNPNGSGLIIVGTNGNDALQGSEDGDLICALDGDDAVQAHGGADTVFGGGGKDAIEAGDGDDEVFGEDDKDVILGDAGNDELNGGQGNDNMSGGAGEDVLRGQGGWDTLKGNADDDLLTGARGNDILQGGGGNDVGRAGAGDDVLKGYRGNDELRGGGGEDLIRGSAGRDRLFGNAGNDVINGGPDRDRCRGGRGRDILRNCR